VFDLNTLASIFLKCSCMGLDRCRIYTGDICLASGRGRGHRGQPRRSHALRDDQDPNLKGNVYTVQTTPMPLLWRLRYGGS
jgi:hypothetical protein